MEITKQNFQEIHESIERDGFWDTHPIVVWDHGNDLIVVCGRNRVRVARELDLAEVPVILVSFKDERAAKHFAIADNLQRRNMSPEQQMEAKVVMGELDKLARKIRDRRKERREPPPKEKEEEEESAGPEPAASPEQPAVEEAEETPQEEEPEKRDTLQIVADEIGVSNRQVGKMKAIRERAPELWERVLDPKDRLTVGHAYTMLREEEQREDYQKVLKEGGTIDISREGILQITDMWRFKGPDPRFGTTAVRGAIPGQICANFLEYFTNRGDLILDPMAGSGVMADVATWMGRTCRSFDLTPTREDIVQNDMLQGLPPNVRDVPVIFLDPPYWGAFMERYPYSQEQNDLANMKHRDQWERAFRAVIKCACAVTAEDGIVAIVHNNENQYRSVRVDHLPHIFKAFETNEFALLKRVEIQIPGHELNNRHRRNARENKYMLRGYRDLLIFKRPQYIERPPDVLGRSIDGDNA